MLAFPCVKDGDRGDLLVFALFGGVWERGRKASRGTV